MCRLLQRLDRGRKQPSAIVSSEFASGLLDKEMVIGDRFGREANV